MAVVLKGSRPLFREALRLSRQAGLVYSVLWEAAWHDERRGKYGRLECGGTTGLSHAAIAELCWLGKTKVIEAIDQLMDDGLITCLWLEPTGTGSWKRRYRVLHSDHVEAQREAIKWLPVKPSVRARLIRERKESPLPEEALQHEPEPLEDIEEQGWEDGMYEKAAGGLQ